MMRSMLCVVAAGMMAGAELAWAQTPDATTPAQAGPAQAGPAGFANREALAWWYLQVDQAWERARPGKDAAGIRAAHEAFDTATLSFFKMDMAGAVRQLARLRGQLETGAADQMVMPIALEVEPRVWIPPASEPTVRLLSADGAGGVGDVELVIEAKAASGESLLRREIRADRGALARGEVMVSGIDWPALRDGMERTGGGDAAKRMPVSVQWTVTQAKAVVGADRLIIAPWSLSERKMQVLARLDVLEGTSADADRRMARSRAALLTDAPSRNKASEFLAQYATLPASLDREVEQIAAGKSPYPLDGTWWTTVRAGKVTAPLWFSSPAERKSGRPLLVVFHGAGGDESMFVFGYGQGALVREAVRRGMVVASPATGATMGSPRVFEAVVSEASRLYGIDPSRVYVAGHSMGGGAVSSLAQRYPTRLAGAVCFAGGNFEASKQCCPTLMLGGEIDPIIPGPRLGIGAKQCIDAGLPITFTLCPGNGHTFIVGDHVGVALDFLGERKSVVPFTDKEPQK
ncbi:MAG: dienelactone hydrolase family protein [Planctomycetota bacterium]|nr:dienelactone hydrolase family protein [Planctomycetota bacterium]